MLAFVLLFVWMAAPALRCLVPGESLTAEEQACCKSMAGQCGDSPGLDHSCCKRATSSNQSAVVTLQVSTIPAIVVKSLISTSFQPFARQEFGHVWLFDPSPPPPRGAHSSSILRI